MSNSEDVAWCRARARQLESGGMEFEDGFVQACRERTEWKKRQGQPVNPAAVSLGDLLKAKDDK